MVELGEEIDIHVTVGNRPDFDYACDIAQSRAVHLLRIDDNGYSGYVKGWERSEHCIKVEFVTMELVGGMTGWEYMYEFKCWAE